MKQFTTTSTSRARAANASTISTALSSPARIAATSSSTPSVQIWSTIGLRSQPAAKLMDVVVGRQLRDERVEQLQASPRLPPRSAPPAGDREAATARIHTPSRRSDMPELRERFRQESPSASSASNLDLTALESPRRARAPARPRAPGPRSHRRCRRGSGSPGVTSTSETVAPGIGTGTPLSTTFQRPIDCTGVRYARVDGELELADPVDVANSAVDECTHAAALLHPDRDQLTEEADALAAPAPDGHGPRRELRASRICRIARIHRVRRHFPADRERPAGELARGRRIRANPGTRP